MLRHQGVCKVHVCRHLLGGHVHVRASRLLRLLLLRSCTSPCRKRSQVLRERDLCLLLSLLCVLLLLLFLWKLRLADEGHHALNLRPGSTVAHRLDLQGAGAGKQSLHQASAVKQNLVSHLARRHRHTRTHTVAGSYWSHTALHFETKQRRPLISHTIICAYP